MLAICKATNCLGDKRRSSNQLRPQRVVVSEGWIPTLAPRCNLLPSEQVHWSQSPHLDQARLHPASEAVSQTHAKLPEYTLSLLISS